jgi:hypothetical protein
LSFYLIISFEDFSASSVLEAESVFAKRRPLRILPAQDRGMESVIA